MAASRGDDGEKHGPRARKPAPLPAPLRPTGSGGAAADGQLAAQALPTAAPGLPNAYPEAAAVPPLKAGGTIAVLAPASPAVDKQEAAAAWLRARGFVPRLLPGAGAAQRGLPGRQRQRASGRSACGVRRSRGRRHFLPARRLWQRTPAGPHRLQSDRRQSEAVCRLQRHYRAAAGDYALRRLRHLSRADAGIRPAGRQAGADRSGVVATAAGPAARRPMAGAGAGSGAGNDCRRHRARPAARRQSGDDRLDPGHAV